MAPPGAAEEPVVAYPASPSARVLAPVSDDPSAARAVPVARPARFDAPPRMVQGIPMLHHHDVGGGGGFGTDRYYAPRVHATLTPFDVEGADARQATMSRTPPRFQATPTETLAYSLATLAFMSSFLFGMPWFVVDALPAGLSERTLSFDTRSGRLIFYLNRIEAEWDDTHEHQSYYFSDLVECKGACSQMLDVSSAAGLCVTCCWIMLTAATVIGGMLVCCKVGCCCMCPTTVGMLRASQLLATGTATVGLAGWVVYIVAFPDANTLLADLAHSGALGVALESEQSELGTAMYVFMLLVWVPSLLSAIMFFRSAWRTPPDAARVTAIG